MKKVLVLFLSLVVLVSCVFVSCSKNETDDSELTSNAGLEDDDTLYGIESQEVTDEDGKKVTDKDGNTVTTDVAVVYKTDKKGKRYAQVIDQNGDPIKGEIIELPEEEQTKKDDNGANNENDPSTNTTTTAPKPTGTTKKTVPLTESAQTTKFSGNETVPKTSATGSEVNFSVEDQSIIKSMLEVPYLYLASYENSDGVPMEIAVHTAVWMAEREGSSRTIYPSSPVVLNLFKYYGQTVINFKTQCNEYAESVNAPIEYVKKDDTFTISNYTPKVQSVTITKIEDLGNNNFYKVTADVTGCNKKKVVAIVQKNRLESTLGFSIKALKWS